MWISSKLLCPPLFALLFIGCVSDGVRSQIVPAVNDAGTVVTAGPGYLNQVEITGGTLVNQNLFHSFEQFGLLSGQTATFLTPATVQHVLARITGNRPSTIDGLIQLSGSTAHLFLINPAGLVFGPNARLDVPGSFIATTANRIGFGEQWLNATGAANYATLVAPPDRAAFTSPVPGSIVNVGNLAVRSGHHLTLLAGQVVNQGTLAAPEGVLTLAAVPAERVVRLTPTGSPLSFEVSTSALAPTLELPPLELPALLTGGMVSSATTATVVDGAVRLSGAGMGATSGGDVLVAGRLDVAGQVGGTIQVLGQQVVLNQATLDASGVQGGGVIRVGGDERGQGPLPTAQTTTINATSWLRADAIATGNGGQVVVWAENTTRFDGAISARGGMLAGDGGRVEVSARRNLVFRGTVNTQAPQGQDGILLLDPDQLTIVDCGGAAPPAICNASGFGGQVLASDSQPNVLAETQLEALAGVTTIVLEANNGITIEDLTDNELRIAAPAASGDNLGTLVFRADANNDGIGGFTMAPGDRLQTDGRRVEISGATATVGTISTFAGASPFSTFNDIRFPTASGDVAITTTGDLLVQRLIGGNITLISQTGNLFTGSISAESAQVSAPPPVTRPGVAVVLSAPQGTVVLDGFIRSGMVNTATDNTLSVTAQRFRALHPINEIESAPSGDRVQLNGLDQRVPMSVYVYPANVNVRVQDDPKQVGTGQVVVQFQDQVPLVTGTGNPLVRIRLLGDRTFAVGQLAADGSSSTAGIIGVGAEQAPSAIVVLRDNQFRAEDETAVAAQPDASLSATLEGAQTESATAPECQTQTPILDVAAVLPAPTTTPANRGEFPCEEPESSAPESSAPESSVPESSVPESSVLVK